MKLSRVVVSVVVLLLMSVNLAFAGETVDAVKKKGYVQVGVNGGVFGFGMPDQKGVWKGLDVDTGRAIAAAVFGDANKIKYTPLTASPALHRPAVGRDRCPVSQYHPHPEPGDHPRHQLCPRQLLRRPGLSGAEEARRQDASELSGATVCVLPGTTTEQNAADYFRSHNMKWKPVVIESTTELEKTFFAGRCDVLTSDASQLAADRSTAANPKDYVLLPEIISKEPLAPAVRQGDDQWRDIVDFSVMAMIEAEELGITSKNVDEMLKSKDPKIQRFLGVEPGQRQGSGAGREMGLQHYQAGRQLR